MSNERNKRPSPAQHADTPDSPSFYEGKHTYVNPYLDDRDKSWLVTNKDTLVEGIFALLELSATYYSVRVSLDRKSGRYLCMVTCTHTDLSNTGLILSVRGSTPFNAMFAAYYLHFVKSDGLWRSVTPQTTTEEFG